MRAQPQRIDLLAPGRDRFGSRTEGERPTAASGRRSMMVAALGTGAS